MVRPLRNGWPDRRFREATSRSRPWTASNRHASTKIAQRSPDPFAHRLASLDPSMRPRQMTLPALHEEGRGSPPAPRRRAAPPPPTHALPGCMDTAASPLPRHPSYPRSPRSSWQQTTYRPAAPPVLRSAHGSTGGLPCVVLQSVLGCRCVWSAVVPQHQRAGRQPRLSSRQHRRANPLRCARARMPAI